MNPKSKLVFILDQFALNSGGQQLLDRFLWGYPRDGTFHRPAFDEVSFCCSDSSHEEIQRRVTQFGLKVSSDVPSALAGASAVIFGDDWLKQPLSAQSSTLDKIPSGSRAFVIGRLAQNLPNALELARQIHRHGISLLAGSPLPVTWRLPPVEIPANARMERSLIVVQGPRPVAEFSGLEGILPVIEKRAGGESGIQQLKLLENDQVWSAALDWSWDLLKAALSRSHTPQGDSALEGRSQDLVGLGLVPKLASHPRALLLKHGDGFRTSILALDGVVADINFAVQLKSGKIYSAQLHRPPKPQDHQYSQLAAVLEDFFLKGEAPWDLRRNILEAGILEVAERIDSEKGEWLETPDLRPDQWTKERLLKGL